MARNSTIVIRIHRETSPDLARKLEKAIPRVQRKTIDLIYTMMKPYIPYKTGNMYNNTIRTTDSIIHNAPYTKYQWSKWYNHYSNNESGLRGPYWVRRMYIDKRELIDKQVSVWIGEEIRK